MVFETTRLQLYPMIYPRQDKCEGRHTIQKRKSGYKRRQPRYTDAQRRVMGMTNNNTRWNAYCTTQTRTSTNNRRRNTNTDQENPNKRTRSNKTIKEKEQTNIERRWNCLHRWQDLCAKKQTTLRQNTQ